MQIKKNIWESLKIKAELIAMVLTLAAICIGGFIEFRRQGDDIIIIKDSQKKQSDSFDQITKTIDKDVVPRLNQHELFIKRIEEDRKRVAEAQKEDRDLLIKIVNDVQWIRERQEKQTNK